MKPADKVRPDTAGKYFLSHWIMKKLPTDCFRDHLYYC